MTVTAEQWAAAAADHGITVAELRAKVAEIDNADVSGRLADALNLPSMHFDRDGDTMTFGEWAILYESPSYKFIAEQILPNRYWIATIWQGINGDFDDPPVVLETSVFLLHPERTELPPSVHRVAHTSLPDALAVHSELVGRYAGTATQGPTTNLP